MIREEKYIVNYEQVPDSISHEVAREILLTGRIFAALKETHESKADALIQESLLDFESLGIAAVKRCKNEASKLLFRTFTDNGTIKKEFSTLRDIYFAGRGDFFDAFIVELNNLKKTSEESMLLITTNGIKMLTRFEPLITEIIQR